MLVVKFTSKEIIIIMNYMKNVSCYNLHITTKIMLVQLVRDTY